MRYEELPSEKASPEAGWLRAPLWGGLQGAGQGPPAGAGCCATLSAQAAPMCFIPVSLSRAPSWSP